MVGRQRNMRAFCAELEVKECHAGSDCAGGSQAGSRKKLASPEHAAHYHLCTTTSTSITDVQIDRRSQTLELIY